MTFISVIIPNYNHAQYLKQRINSVLNQSYQNFEVILLDDCSTDNSREIIEKYRNHSKVSKIVYNDTNSGSTFKQWQKGIELAQGEWIWIAESDDVANVDFLSVLSRFFTPNYSIVYCKSRMINEDGQPLGNGTLPNFEIDIDLLGLIFAKTYMLKSNNIPNASAVLFRKCDVDMSVFNLINQTRLLGDWIFWLDLMIKNNHVIFENKILNDYRFHSNTVRSNTNKTEQKLPEYIKLSQYVNKILNKNNETMDHLLYLYHSDKAFGSSISLKNRLKIIFFFLTSCPVIYFKTIIKSFFK